MKRQLTFQQYRMVDLALWAVMLALFEFLIITAATAWFPAQPYTVSVVASVTAIVMMRWRPYAAIHAVLGGLVFCLCSGAAVHHYIIYCVGNLFAMLALLMIHFIGAERIRSDALRSMLFGLAVQLLMHFGRYTMAIILGYTFGNGLGFITTDALSIVFTLVIIWVTRNLDGVFEDQKTYLLRLQEEREKERGE